MTTPDAFNKFRAIGARFYPSDVNVRLLGAESAVPPPGSGPEIKLSIVPSISTSELRLTGTVEAELPDSVAYEVTVYGVWQRTPESLSTEDEIRDLVLSQGLRELATVLNYELRSLGARYGRPIPTIDYESLLELDDYVMNDSQFSTRIKEAIEKSGE